MDRPQCDAVPGANRLSGLQLDLLTTIVRLEQIDNELERGNVSFAHYLLRNRVVKCDVPRLRRYLSEDAYRLLREAEYG